METVQVLRMGFAIGLLLLGALALGLSALVEWARRRQALRAGAMGLTERRA
jgi:hypothetical protein